MIMKNIEFLLDPEGELIYKNEDGVHTFTQSDTELIDFILNKVKNEFPKAYDCLMKTYSKSFQNPVYYRFLMPRRFCRCNFCRADMTTVDIDENGNFRLEDPICPLRGECEAFRIICLPKNETKLSDREIQVLKLWGRNMTVADISQVLYISMSTVHCHISSIYKKIKINSQAEAVAYININRL